MSQRDFALPDLGEGLTESELVEWHVAVGDRVELNQTLADVETAKAVVQLPSPFAGTITALYAEPGATVAVGAPLVGFDVEVDADAEVPPVAEPVEAPAEPLPVAEAVEAPAQQTDAEASAAAAPARTAVLVGYGPAADTGSRPKRRARRGAGDGAGEASPAAERVEAPRRNTEGGPIPTTHTGPALATPPVRKLAHDLGVDLHRVQGTGDGGVITREDVRSAAEASLPELAEGSSDATRGGASTGSATEDGASTAETRIPIRGVRKSTAAAMVASAFTAPHVTEFLTVDVTPTVELVARLKARGTRASMLSIVGKAMCLAIARTPEVNSRWDEQAGEIVQFGHVGLGIAVATPRGLLVPVIRHAHALSLDELTASIADIAATARAGEATPAQLSGGTISITNFGVFGVDAGTPILVPGEAAIVGIGAVRRMPWEHEGQVALRDVMTLSLSFDHRLVDGEQGSRFLTDVGGILADPGSVLAL